MSSLSTAPIITIKTARRLLGKDAEKRQKLDEADSAIAQLELQRTDADQYLRDRVDIIDAAMLFMDDPAAFWNMGGVQVKKRVQDLVFPDGLTYDCEDGFRTPQLSSSYLLMKNIALASDTNPNVVAATRLELVTPGL